MAWMKLIEEEEASDKLKKYCKNIKRTRGKIANILEVQSLTQSPKGSPRPLPSSCSENRI